MNQSAILEIQKQTIDSLQQQIHRLQTLSKNKISPQIAQAAKNQYQNKYKRAIAQLSLVIKANRSLKEQVQDLKNRKSFHHDNGFQIQRDQFQKAYQKVLNEKNQYMMMVRQREIEIQRLKYNVETLQQYIAELKSQHITLNRQKQALQRKVIKNQLINYGSDKESQTKNIINSSPKSDTMQTLKNKQYQYQKIIENYQNGRALLNSKNHQLQQRIKQLEIFIAKNQELYKSNQQYLLIKTKNEIQNKMNEKLAKIEKQNRILKNKHSQLFLKLEKNAQSIFEKDPESSSNELFSILSQIYSQFQPIKTDIESIHNQKDQQYLKLFREKQNLRIKLLEKDSQNSKLIELNKNLQRKIIKNNQDIKKYKEDEKKSTKTDQLNRALQQKVFQLQNQLIFFKGRSELNNPNINEAEKQFLKNNSFPLLNNNNNNIIQRSKSSEVLQTVALQTYIVELDIKIKQLQQIIKQKNEQIYGQKIKFKQLEQAMSRSQVIEKQYKAKIEGYDRLIKKMELQLQKAIEFRKITLLEKSRHSRYSNTKQNNIQISNHYSVNKANDSKHLPSNIKIKQAQNQRIFYQKQIYQIKSAYQTKIMFYTTLQEEIKDLRNANKLYKSKNQQLMEKINQKQNQLLETRIEQSRRISEMKVFSDYSQPSLDQHITQLHIAMNQKQTAFMRLEIELKDMNRNWSQAIRRLEEQNRLLKNPKQKPVNFQLFSYRADQTFIKISESLSKYKERISQLQKQIEKLQNQKASYHLNLLNIKKNNPYPIYNQHQFPHSSQIHQENKLRWKQKEIAYLNEQIISLKEDLKSFKDKDNQIDKLKNEIFKLKSQMHFNNELEQLKALKITLQKRIQDITNLSNQRLHEIQVLKEEINHLKVKKPSPKIDNEALYLQTQYNKLMKQIDQLNIKINQFQTLIHLKEIEIHTLKKDKYFFEMENSRLKSDLNQQKKLYEELKISQNHLKGELEQQTDLRIQNENNLKRIKEQLKHLKQNYNKMITAVQLGQLGQSKQSMINSIQTYGDTNKSKNVLNMLNKQIEDKNHIIFNLKQEIRKLQYQNDELNSKLFELQVKYSQLEKNINVKNLESEHLQRQWILKLQQDLAATKFKITTYEAQLQEKQSIISRLHQEVMHLRIYGLSNSNVFMSQEIKNEIKSKYSSLKQTPNINKIEKVI